MADDPKPKQPWRTRNNSRWDRPKYPRDWRFWLGGLGRILITLGVLMFGFVGYQLWGTGIQYAQAQNKLEDEFNELLSSTSVVTTTVPPATTTSTTTAPAPGDTVPVPVLTTAPAVTVAPPPAPSRSSGFARLEIPRIGAVDIVVEGVRVADLKKGPGHFPETPLPGQLGQSAIAGHRTTYGSPFGRIDEVKVGDEIIVTTLAGRYVYRATGTRIVGANDYADAIPSRDPSLATIVLISCHPEYTARQRIVVSALLSSSESSPLSPQVIFAEPDLGPDDTLPTGPGPVDTGPVDTGPVDTGPGASTPTDTVPSAIAPSTPTPVTTTSLVTDDTVNSDGVDAFTGGWFTDTAAWPHIILWGLGAALVALGAYGVARWFRRLWIGVLVGIAPFLFVLYFFYENVNRMLPPGL